MAQVFRPTDGVSVRKVSQTDADRKNHLKEFREDKAHKQKLKEERFAKIAEKRKTRPSSSKGNGINVKIGSDN